MLLFINCLDAGDPLSIGQQLFVPFEVAISSAQPSSPSLEAATEIPPTRLPRREADQGAAI